MCVCVGAKVNQKFLLTFAKQQNFCWDATISVLTKYMNIKQIVTTTCACNEWFLENSF